MPKKITVLDFCKYLDNLYKKNSRQMRFAGSTRDEFIDWQTQARAKLIELLAIDHLDLLPLDLELLSEKEQENYLVQKISYQTLPNVRVPAYLLTPKRDYPMPTVLCPHGHGFGKEQVMNENGSYNKYPRHLADAGFVALVPDHISFGERANPDKRYSGCTFEHEALNLLGGTIVGYRMWDLQRAVDLLEKLPQVDSSRIGCAGLSLGGEMTLYLTACDTRIKAAVISCFLTSFAGTFLKEPHCYCGYIPKMAKYFEHADIAALISPRPLMIQAGLQDPSFLVKDAQASYEELKPLYKLFEEDQKITIDVFDQGHIFHLEPAVEWLKKWLVED